jgi:hypothetical protein
MEKVFGLYNHEDFGSLRTLVTEGVVLFCANDVAEALGFPNPQDAVKRYCNHIEQHGSAKALRFIGIDDVMRLVNRSKSENADSFKGWLLGEVLPAIFRDAGIDTEEDNDDGEEYIIRLGDYMARIYLEVALYETLNCLVRGIRNLPDDGIDAHALKVFAEKSAELVDGAFFSSGITREFIAKCNIDDISELLDDVLLTPEDAGYIPAEDVPDDNEDDYDADDLFEYDGEDDTSETGDVSAILDCCKRLLSVASSQLGKQAE